ncbi:MAG: sigma-70 family RNA polymerase sigma factor [Clostridia bacterium]|nr:sigma-70 family RNA polymerase sigma factor [Clostridia bacterium]
MNDLFTDELILNTYLFCQKRLRPQDAEECAQDILCEALAGLRAAEHRGRQIAAFHPWYWTLARNRLNLFLRLKYNGAAPLDAVSGYLASGEDPLDGLISQEEVSALNFALSRLSRLHREIIIEYYLRELPIETIARRLDIPAGTVKRRLFDARENVKRSVENHMETIGRSAYAPASLQLFGTYQFPKYLDKISDLMTRQIFAATAKSARTIREIADEIGVAPVYFEDKIDYLLENRFLKETSNGRYIADFIILPAQASADFWYASTKVFEPVGGEITAAIRSVEDKLRGLGFYGSDFAEGYLMWLWYVYACQGMSNVMQSAYRASKPDVPASNGKDYCIEGVVTYPDEKIIRPDEPPKAIMNWSNLHNQFRTSDYRFIEFGNLYEAEPFGDRDSVLTDANIGLFMRLFDNPSLALTGTDEETAAGLVGKGFLEKREGGLYPTLPIFTLEQWKEMQNILTEAVQPLCGRYMEKIAALGESILLPHVRPDLYHEYVNYTMRIAFWPLHNVMWYGMNAGTLEIPGDYSRSAACTMIWYRK